jgi:phosphinothricin acetyltransferase
VIRVATAHDAVAVAEIYAPIVATTPVSFEEDVPSADEMRGRILKTLETYPWLVWDTGTIGGYAYATTHRARPAYRWSVEVSAYVREDARGGGIATSLYSALFRILRAQGFHRAFAGIALPNDASAALHSACGFEPIGIFRDIGYKLGSWHDTQWWQRDLGNDGEAPREPTPLARLDGALVEELIGLDAP